MKSTHCARYLVLLGPADARRALLFSGEHRYLAEMIDDDGIMTDTLLKSSRVCPKPRSLSLEAVAAPDQLAAGEDMRCFLLD